jgi:hypothetical protein
VLPDVRPLVPKVDPERIPEVPYDDGVVEVAPVFPEVAVVPYVFAGVP